MKKRGLVLAFTILLFGFMMLVSAQNETIKCYQDSDCGQSSRTTYCNDSQSCTSEKVYYCYNPGKPESYCTEKGGTSCSICQDGCKDGLCLIKVAPAPVCGNGVCEGDEKTTCTQDCPQATACTDSDGGKNYEIKGTSKDSYSYESTDYCNNEKTLTEYYCQYDEIKGLRMYTESHWCDYGCKDGVCLAAPTPVCGNGICESGEETSCTKDCIKCYKDSDCGVSETKKTCGSPLMVVPGKPYSNEDYACISTTEHKCENPGTTSSRCGGGGGASCIPCPNGCKDGNCIGTTTTTPATCTDSDGIDYYTQGKVCADTNCITDRCEGNTVFEYVCDGTNIRIGYTYGCPGGCQNGACTKGEELKEQVKCIFQNSKSEQKCYLAEYNEKYKCSGTETCVIDVFGSKGDSLVWKSTCGGYAYTTIDGRNDETKFDCSQTPIPTTPMQVPTTPVQTTMPAGFRNAYWQCYDGTEEKQGSESSCKPSEVWKKYAEEACRYRCKTTDTEHKKCAVVLSSEERATKLTVKGKEYIIELVSASDTSVTLKIANSGSVIKEIPVGTREKVFDLTIMVNAAKPGKADIVVEGEESVSCEKCGLNSFSVYNECYLDTIITQPVCGNGICESGEWEICEIAATTCKEGEICKASTGKCYVRCPQDCPKGKEGIYSKLDEKFKLEMSQEVKFKDYQNLVIKFNDLFVPECAVPEKIEEKEKSAVVEKYNTLTGKAVSTLLSEFMTSAPQIAVSECIGREPYAVLQMKFYGDKEKTEVIKLQIGEKKIVFDAVISFLDYDKELKSGVFVVSLADTSSFTCPENCICDISGKIKECRRTEECKEKEILCPDGTCKEQCEMTNITTECKFGCFYQNKCLPYGLRVKGLYCDISNAMRTQLAADEACENSFECSSNVCIDGKCISSGLIQKILDFFRRLFGKE